METALLATLLLFIAAVHSGVCLMCYKCTSTEPECKEPFNTTLAKVDNIYIRVDPGYYCVKLVYVTGKEKFIIRDIKTLREAQYECSKRNFQNGSDTCSWCKQPDGCNGANSATRIVESLSRTLINFMVPCIITLIITS